MKIGSYYLSVDRDQIRRTAKGIGVTIAVVAVGALFFNLIGRGISAVSGFDPIVIEGSEILPDLIVDYTVIGMFGTMVATIAIALLLLTLASSYLLLIDPFIELEKVNNE